MEVWRPHYHVGKFLTTSPLEILQWRIIMLGRIFMVLITLIRWSMNITCWWLWHMSTHLCDWWKGKNSAGWWLTLIHLFNLLLGINWKGPLYPRNEINQERMFLHWLMLCVILSFPMNFVCRILHRKCFQWWPVSHMSMSGIMLALGCLSQHQHMVRVLY